MISAVQLDVLSEIVNIGAGKAVALLDDMLGHRVQLEVPELLSVSRNELQEHIAIMDSPALVTVRLGFHGAVQGSACLVFPSSSADNLARLLADDLQQVGEFEEFKRAAIIEVGNIVLNGIMGQLGNCLGLRIDYDVPQFKETRGDPLLKMTGYRSSDVCLLSKTHFRVVGKDIIGSFVILFAGDSIRSLLRSMKSSGDAK